MNKIKEAFEKWREPIFGKSIGGTNYTYEAMYKSYLVGREAANPLPTERDCPDCVKGRIEECDERGLRNYACPNCKNGKIQIYYTPEEFKTIMGYDYPDDAYVLVYLLGKWIFELYGRILDEYKSVCVIVQTAQKCPGADYKKEVIK